MIYLISNLSFAWLLNNHQAIWKLADIHSKNWRNFKLVDNKIGDTLSFWTKEFWFIFFMTLRIYIKKSSVNHVSHSGFEVYIFQSYEFHSFDIFIHILRTFLLTSLIWLQLHSMYSHFYPFFFFTYIIMRRCQFFFIPPVKLVVCITASTQQVFFSKFSSVNLVN